MKTGINIDNLSSMETGMMQAARDGSKKNVRHHPKISDVRRKGGSEGKECSEVKSAYRLGRLKCLVRLYDGRPKVPSWHPPGN